MIRRALAAIVFCGLPQAPCSAGVDPWLAYLNATRNTASCLNAAPTGGFTSLGITGSTVTGGTLTTAFLANPLCASSVTAARYVEGSGTTNQMLWTYTAAIAAGGASHTFGISMMPIRSTSGQYPRTMKLSFALNTSLGTIDEFFDPQRCVLTGNYQAAAAPMTTASWTAKPVLWAGQMGCVITISGILPGATPAISATLIAKLAVGLNSGYSGVAGVGAGAYFWGAWFN